MKKRKLFLSIIFLQLLTFNLLSQNNDWELLMDLEGYWKFNIGNEPSWAQPTFNDFKWEDIRVPEPWENQGFHGYDGYAWYRRSFTLKQGQYANNLYLHLGYIDDVDEVYINGKLIGFSGSFPPEYYTSYNAYRRYRIPLSALNTDGKNVIAVKVYDHHIEGGILKGDIGIYTKKQAVGALDLQGLWNFSKGDNMEWAKPDFHDLDWQPIMVPAAWEHQKGKRYYDGYGWYRLTFYVPNNLSNDAYLMVLGRIDDFDQAFLNGQFIGETNDRQTFGRSNSYRQLRAYNIPDGLLRKGKMNTIAVRVFDIGHNGGIVDGPIALVSKSQFSRNINTW